jgi:hypothetical protein
MNGCQLNKAGLWSFDAGAFEVPHRICITICCRAHRHFEVVDDDASKVRKFEDVSI